MTRLSGAVFAAFWLSFVAAQMLSWRHSSGERRQQLKWLMSEAAALAVSQAIDQLSIAIDPNPPALANGALDLITGLGLAANKRQARPGWKPSESVRSFGLSWAICSPRYADVHSCATALLLLLLLAGRTV